VLGSRTARTTGRVCVQGALQPAPLCGACSPAKATARGEGRWHPGLLQPFWEALEIPQVVLRWSRERTSMNLTFLSKNDTGKKKKKPTHARLHINQGNKTACGGGKIIRSKSI